MCVPAARTNSHTYNVALVEEAYPYTNGITVTPLGQLVT